MYPVKNVFEYRSCWCGSEGSTLGVPNSTKAPCGDHVKMSKRIPNRRFMAIRHYVLTLVLIMSSGTGVWACFGSQADHIFCADFDSDDLSQWDALPMKQGEDIEAAY